MIKNHFSTALLASALALGVLGDRMGMQFPWGLGATLWMLTFIGWFLFLARSSGRSLPGGWWLPPAALTLLSLCMLWRDAPVLVGLNLLMIFLAGTLLMTGTSSRPLWMSSFLDGLHAALATVSHTAFGAFFLARGEFRTSVEKSPNWKSATTSVARGVLLATLPVLVFTRLFVSADAEFERLATTFLNIDFGELVFHALTIGFVAWCVGGFLRGRFLASPVAPPDRPPAARPLVGLTELWIVMGSIDLLFLSFTVVQIHELFGGAAVVAETPGLTLAQFARRGFFELVTVAALSLPLLVVIDMVTSKERRAAFLFRMLAGLQVALLFAIMASALERMFLYQQQFGLTELRLYTTAFMIWLGLVFLWFVWTTLRGRSERFLFGSLASAMAVLLFLHLLNPDDLIARTNIARAQAGAHLDLAYLCSLSDDAAPVLVERFSTLGPDDQRLLLGLFRDRLATRSGDWRTWNRSRARAQEATESLLRAYPSPPAQSDQSQSVR